MNKNNSLCPRCKQSFDCKALDIANCDCRNITLSANERAYMAQTFNTCLCPSCLLQLKTEFATHETA